MLATVSKPLSMQRVAPPNAEVAPRVAGLPLQTPVASRMPCPRRQLALGGSRRTPCPLPHDLLPLQRQQQSTHAPLQQLRSLQQPGLLSSLRRS